MGTVWKRTHIYTKLNLSLLWKRKIQEIYSFFHKSIIKHKFMLNFLFSVQKYHILILKIGFGSFSSHNLLSKFVMVLKFLSNQFYQSRLSVYRFTKFARLFLSLWWIRMNLFPVIGIICVVNMIGFVACFSD